MEIRESDRVTRHKADKLAKRKLSCGEPLEEKRPVQSKRDVFSGANGRFSGLIPAISYGRTRFFLRQTNNRLFEKKMLMSSYRHGAIYMSAPQTHENSEKSGIGLYFFLYLERTRLPETDDRMSYMLPDMLTRPPPACGAHAPQACPETHFFLVRLTICPLADIRESRIYIAFRPRLQITDSRETRFDFLTI